MRWLLTPKRQPGWLAVDLHEDRVDVVHVAREPGGRPVVSLCESYRKDGPAVETLERIARDRKLKRYQCTTLLARQSYQLHQIEAPGVPADEIRAAVRWRVKDIIDYPVESASIDVLDIPADPAAPAPDHVLYVVTAPTTVVAACAQPFNDAGIPLQVVDIPELAQRNIAALFEHGQGVAMLVFYEDEGILTFTRAGELYNARRIDITLAQLVTSDPMRRRGYFERIALEVQRSLDHLERDFHYVPLVKLLLGPVAAEIGLAEYLQTLIEAPVETVDLATVLDISATPELRNPASQSQYLRTIGAALRDEEKAAA